MSRSHVTTDLPPTPPPEPLGAVVDAWERAEGLHAAGWDLEIRRARQTGRVRAALRDPAGGVVRRLTAREVLAFACGDPLDCGAPERA